MTSFYNSGTKLPFGSGARIPAETDVSGDAYVDMDDFQPKINEITDYISGLIESPEDKTYTLIRNSPVEITITEVTAITTAGSATATVRIGGVSLGGSANSVTTTESVQSHASANVVAVGGDLTLVISANSSAENIAFTVKYTRGV